MTEKAGATRAKEFKDVAATQLLRSHIPESYAVDFQPICDGGRGRLDSRYQYRRKVQPPLGAFYRGLQLRLEAAAFADSSMISWVVDRDPQFRL